jgi:hypothetical protein
MQHLGNLLVPRMGLPLPLPDLQLMELVLPYGKSSHVVPLLLHDHQVGVMNRLYEAYYRWRTHEFYAEKVKLGFKDERLAVLSSTQTHHVEESVRKLVAELLFKDEAALPGVAVEVDGGFSRAFSAGARKDDKGRSLRELELTTRLLRYRCSHLIYCPQLQGMRPEFRKQVFTLLAEALLAKSELATHLPAEERQCIHEILLQTLPEYAAVSS